MRKQTILFLGIFSFCLIRSAGVIAQTDVNRYKIAIFAPLYLDSAYNSEGGYRFSKTSFPKYIIPGLEFYQGVKLALDSLDIEKAPLEIFVYDTKSSKETLAQQLNNPEIDSASVIIAHCSSSEIKLLADAGLKKHIPVINVNMPNDGGVTGNPFFVILNPTLRTQCEGIYRHLQKYYSLNPIVVFKRKGQSMDDRIKMYLDEFGKNTVAVPLQLKYVELSDSFTVNQLRPHLDTSVQTLCIAGSLDETFGKKIIQQLAALQKENYQAAVMGMPTWDGISLSKSDYKGIEIIYSTPFYNAKVDKISRGIVYRFNKAMFARPSDMVFRGYEVTFRFARMLLQYKKEIASNLATKYTKVFTDFDIQPVLNKQTMTLDYFENKKLYFLKWEDGVLKAIY